MSPAAERLTSRTPVQMIFAATRRARRGSSHSQPVSQTAATPRITPTEVQTSVSR